MYGSLRAWSWAEVQLHKAQGRHSGPGPTANTLHLAGCHLWSGEKSVLPCWGRQITSHHGVLGFADWGSPSPKLRAAPSFKAFTQNHSWEMLWGLISGDDILLHPGSVCCTALKYGSSWWRDWLQRAFINISPMP